MHVIGFLDAKACLILKIFLDSLSSITSTLLILLLFSYCLILPPKYSCMLFHRLVHRSNPTRVRLSQMTAHFSNGVASAMSNGILAEGVSLADLPKSNVFTSSLPADSKFPSPLESFKASREELGPRMVKGALYTYVRPETKIDPVLLGISERAMRDIGIQAGEEETEDFKQMTAGNKIMWDEASGKGIYPWAQCYGGQ